MRAGKKRWVWLALVLIFAAVLGILIAGSHGPSGVSISFIAYTNAPNDHGKLRFALMSVTNNDRVKISCRGVSSGKLRRAG